MYTDVLQHLADEGLTAAIIIANFNRRRVLPLMERKLPLFKMMEGAPSEGTQMTTELLSDKVATLRVARAVSQPLNDPKDFWRVAMHPNEGYINVVSLVPKPRRRHHFLFPNLSPVHRGCVARGTLRTLCSQRFGP